MIAALEILLQMCELERKNKKIVCEFITRAVKVLSNENDETPLTADLYNNLGVAEYRSGKFMEASESFKKATEQCIALEVDSDDKIRRILNFTYAVARSMEASGHLLDAHEMYKMMYAQCPQFARPLLRLGSMSEERGNKAEALEFYTEALRKDPNSKEAWLMLGNFHMKNQELGPAQRKYEHVIEMTAPHKSIADEDTKKEVEDQTDVYALLAMASIWLNTLNMRGSNQEQIERHTFRALDLYCKVLRKYPNCAIAANGVGCVLAHKGHVNRARFIFGKVKHTRPDYRDVYLNFAALFNAAKRFDMACNNYTSCEKLFPMELNAKLYIMTAKAQLKDGHFSDAERTLKKGTRSFPDDTALFVSNAHLRQLHAIRMLCQRKLTTQDAIAALDHISCAKKVFEDVSKNEMRIYSKHVAEQATERQKQCAEILNSSSEYLNKAELYEAREKERRRKKFEAFAAQAQLMYDEKMAREKKEKEKMIEMEITRKAAMEKAEEQRALWVIKQKANNEGKPKRKRGKTTAVDSTGQSNNSPIINETDNKNRRRRKKARKDVDSGGMKISTMSSGEGTQKPVVAATDEKVEPRQSNEDDKKNYKSKAFISTDDDSDLDSTEYINPAQLNQSNTQECNAQCDSKPLKRPSSDHSCIQPRKRRVISSDEEDMFKSDDFPEAEELKDVEDAT
ncbi:hypothetical protein ACOME3_009219 [Neoechinorhynchus agilis]